VRRREPQDADAGPEALLGMRALSEMISTSAEVLRPISAERRRRLSVSSRHGADGSTACAHAPSCGGGSRRSGHARGDALAAMEDFGERLSALTYAQAATAARVFALGEPWSSEEKRLKTSSDQIRTALYCNVN
jgi:hypothetical protein